MRRFFRIVLLMTLAISLATISANAQVPVKFGIKGGLNSSTVIGDDADSFESRSGFVGGVFTRLPFAGPSASSPFAG